MIPQRMTGRGLTQSLLLFALTAVASADVRLPALFSDNMVFQQAMPVPVWGWADTGEKVVVEFRGYKVSTVAKEGKWRVMLPRLWAGGPDTMVVTGRNRLEVRNVLVGEVWVCSGQSNMEWPLRAAEGGKEDIAAAANPQIRLFLVPKLKASQPRDDVAATWKECSPQSTENFSAVAYYFGREIQKHRKVPVGLIETCWGGSPAEVWLSEKALAANPDYQKNILDAYPATWRQYQASLIKAEKEEADAKAQGRQPAFGRPWPPWKPTELYNGMIAPLLRYGIRGAIWYQGESNAGRAYEYRSLFADMIRNWRHDWAQDNFAFLAVQLAPWDRNKKRSFAEITAAPVESDWAELREAQNIVADRLPNVGVAVITDVGDKDDIHPTQKRVVGERLAYLARKISYREPITSTGPTFSSMRVKGSQAILSFSNVGRGLAVRGEPLTGFAVCGEDRKFVWADARVEGNRVVLSSSLVEKPVAVRYGWADYPVLNLWNLEGFPASPFRTDDFPMLTQPKK